MESCGKRKNAGSNVNGVLMRQIDSATERDSSSRNRLREKRSYPKPLFADVQLFMQLLRSLRERTVILDEPLSIEGEVLSRFQELQRSYRSIITEFMLDSFQLYYFGVHGNAVHRRSFRASCSSRWGVFMHPS